MVTTGHVHRISGSQFRYDAPHHPCHLEHHHSGCAAHGTSHRAELYYGQSMYARDCCSDDELDREATTAPSSRPGTTLKQHRTRQPDADADAEGRQFSSRDLERGILRGEQFMPEKELGHLRRFRRHLENHEALKQKQMEEWLRQRKTAGTLWCSVINAWITLLSKNHLIILVLDLEALLWGLCLNSPDSSWLSICA